MSIVPISTTPRHCRYCNRLHTNITYVYYCSTTCKEAAAHRRASIAAQVAAENITTLKCFICGETFPAAIFLAHYRTHEDPFDPLHFHKQ